MWSVGIGPGSGGKIRTVVVAAAFVRIFEYFADFVHFALAAAVAAL